MSKIGLAIFAILLFYAAQGKKRLPSQTPILDKYVIYRLIGNDMPPLQSVGQLRRNTAYALNNEPKIEGVGKKWILNRIWNRTEFSLVLQTLEGAGVKHHDILIRKFDYERFSQLPNATEKQLYLTSQNEGRNEGIKHGIRLGFQWVVMLDGNTFVTKDSWLAIRASLDRAVAKNMSYMKIPYHRVHSEQSVSWLNKTTSMKTVLQYAPMKGESQMAFHRSANIAFELGDTKPDAHDPAKRKGYGARNKSYLFKEGGICGPGSQQCMCSEVFEGNEEDVHEDTSLGDYTKKCGLVVRLWHYPTEDVVYTGLSKSVEHGFFCYLLSLRKSIQATSECARVSHLAQMWSKLPVETRDAFKKRRSMEALCKSDYSSIVLTESCFRAKARQLALEAAFAGIEVMYGPKERAAH